MEWAHRKPSPVALVTKHESYETTAGHTPFLSCIKRWTRSLSLTLNCAPKFSLPPSIVRSWSARAFPLPLSFALSWTTRPSFPSLLRSQILRMILLERKKQHFFPPALPVSNSPPPVSYRERGRVPSLPLPERVFPSSWANHIFFQPPSYSFFFFIILCVAFQGLLPRL